MMPNGKWNVKHVGDNVIESEEGKNEDGSPNTDNLARDCL